MVAVLRNCFLRLPITPCTSSPPTTISQKRYHHPRLLTQPRAKP